ncbi:metallophosphoesterase [Caenimonas sedimenti]|uniref:Metallophosphoesterase n=1 Tax=Caenimonas sedimenti TaxID=2596921 RepID=A0A562ZEG8_9BURK|nr:metallophosphoesterase [Caenimonas sedimenti]TWO64472.1 metallophosphoesterase [Caenimonas sedimenti]
MLFAVFVSLGLHFYIGSRLGPALPPTAGLALALLLAASAILMPLGLMARRVRSRALADRLTWAGMLCMGLFSSLLVLTLLRDALLLMAWVVDGWFTGLPWAQWRQVSAQAVPLLALAATAIGLLNARRTARVVHVDVPLPQLTPALAGLRIVQISDIHVGPTIKARYLAAIVDAVNRLEPDIVAITGDLVDGSVAELAAHVAPLARLRARHGSFFVTGNHEYYSGVEGWVAELRRLGVRVLHNEHVVLEHDGARLVLAGVTDFSGGHFDARHASDPVAAARGAPAGLTKVLLAHQPRSAPAAARAGFDLQLSGHTHGGQFLPWSFFVRLQQPFTAGLHALDGLLVYVSRGTGYWGPPKRLGAPSEITQLRLAAKPAAP